MSKASDSQRVADALEEIAKLLRELLELALKRGGGR